ncbi:MAG TPA: VCBS repeat-containing protein, partial [Thermoplasmata archaeon]|nr:VCBS repeat-containing protein [Thermoplasmata archaeon]
MRVLFAMVLLVTVGLASAPPVGIDARPDAVPPPVVVVSRYDQARTGVATDVGDITAPAILWSFQTNGTVATSPLAADLDGDGTLEIIFGEFKPDDAQDGSRLAYVLDNDRSVRYTVPMRYNSVVSAIADLDGDGRPEVVFSEGSHWEVTGDLGYRVVRGSDGSPFWSMTTSSSPGEGFFASPALTDVDGDGGLDLIAGAMDDTVYALRGTDGSVLWSVPQIGHYVRHSTPMADFTGDGRPDVTVQTEAGVALAYDAAAGLQEWLVDLGDIVAATPAIGDLDGDGRPEIVYSLVEDG